MKQNLKTLGRFIFDLVFPITCMNCGREKTFLCERCLYKLEGLKNQLCLVCQKPAPYGRTHEKCVSRNTVDGSISALNYKNYEVKQIIATFKYKFIQILSDSLVSRLVKELNQQGLIDHFQKFTLVPVPLHKRRFRWRGFNQSELLTDSLAKVLHINVNKDLIHRVKHAKPQTKLTREERKTNLAQTFAIKNPPRPGGKFIIVDDVVTTGSTVNEIAKILKRSGASETWAITVAHG
jgi:competence protein ComFC